MARSEERERPRQASQQTLATAEGWQQIESVSVSFRDREESGDGEYKTSGISMF